MINIIKGISKKAIIFSILFLITLSGYSQLQFSNKTTQQSRLKTAMANIRSVNGLPSVITIAIMQFPDTNTFYMASNGNSISRCIHPAEVMKELKEQGFATTFNGMPMHLVLIKGVNDSGTKNIYANSSTHTFRIIGLPYKRILNPQTGVYKTLDVHAEMNLLAGISKDLPVLTPYQSDNFVISSDKNFCHRCRAFLFSNGFFVGGLDKISTNIIHNNWSLPNYSSSNAAGTTTYNWPNWLRVASFIYNNGAINQGMLVNRQGQDMRALYGLRTVPQDPYWIESEDTGLSDSICLEILYLEYIENL